MRGLLAVAARELTARRTILVAGLVAGVLPFAGPLLPGVFHAPFGKVDLALDVFRATFPAGTMTGAPKVRAMEIIDELEPERRGPYAGAVGYIAAGDGRMDLAITIRTCVIANGEASVQAGAGIVADSVPEREWEETENKARALLTAIGQVRARRPA